jgi:hypothetical protein
MWILCKSPRSGVVLLLTAMLSGCVGTRLSREALIKSPPIPDQSYLVREKYLVTGFFPGQGALVWFGGKGGDECDGKNPAVRYLVAPLLGPLVVIIGNGAMLWFPTWWGWVEAARGVVDPEWCSASLIGACTFTCMRNLKGSELQ